MKYFPFIKNLIPLLFILTQSISVLSQDSKTLYPMRQKFKWGFINKKGKWVIKPEYNWVRPFSEGFAAVVPPLKEQKNDGADKEDKKKKHQRSPFGRQQQKAKKWRIINKEGEYAFDMKFHSRGMYTTTNYGVFKPSEAVDPFSEGKAPVAQGSELFYINKQGKKVITGDFNAAHPFNEGLARASKNRKTGFINHEGKWQIKPRYDEAKDFSQGLAAVKLKGKWGFIDKKGNMVIDTNFAEVLPFSYGLAKVKSESKKRKDGYYGLTGYINKNGKMAIPFQYDAFSFDKHGRFSHGLAMVENREDEIGYINTKGETVIPFQYEEGRDFSNGLARVKNNNDKMLFINKKGETVIPPDSLKEFGYVSDFHKGLAMVTFKPGEKKNNYTRFMRGWKWHSRGSYYGYINKKGEIIAKQSKEEIEYCESIIDSIKHAKEMKKKREKKKKLQKEKQKLKDCENKLVYGDSTDSNYLEINMQEIKRKFYFKKMLVVKEEDNTWGKTKYNIHYPPFGVSKDEYSRMMKEAKNNMKPKQRMAMQMFGGMFKSMMKNKMSNYVIMLEKSDNFGMDAEFKKHNFFPFDCIRHVRNERFEDVYESNKVKADINQLSNDKIEIDFAIKGEKDTNNYIKGHLITKHLIDKDKVTASRKKVQKYIIDNNKYKQVEMKYYPRRDLIKYRKPNYFNYKKLDISDNKNRVLKKNGDNIYIYELKEINEDNIFINKYLVEGQKTSKKQSKENKKKNSSFFIPPEKNPQPKKAEEYNLNNAELIAHYHSKHIITYPYLPHIFELKNTSGKKTKANAKSTKMAKKGLIKPKNVSIGTKQLPKKALPSFKKIHPVKGSAMNYYYSVKKDKWHGKDCWKLITGEEKAFDEDLKIIKNTLLKNIPENEKNTIKTISNVINARLQYLKNSDEENFRKTLQKAANNLNLEIEKKDNPRMYFAYFIQKCEDKYGDEIVEKIGKYGSMKAAKEIWANFQPMIKVINKHKKPEVRQKIQFKDSLAFKKEFNSLLKEKGYNTRYKKEFSKMKNKLKNEIKDKNGRHVASAIFDYFDKAIENREHDNTLYINSKTGLPLYREHYYKNTKLEINYNKNGEILLNASNDQKKQESYKLKAPEGILDIHQLHSSIASLSLDKNYKDTLYFFANDVKMRHSYSTSHGSNHSIKFKPAFGRAIVKVQDKMRYNWKRAFKVKVTFEGDIMNHNQLFSYKELKAEKNNAPGYLTYYISKKDTPKILAVEKRNQIIPFFY